MLDRWKNFEILHQQNFICNLKNVKKSLFQVYLSPAWVFSVKLGLGFNII